MSVTFSVRGTDVDWDDQSTYLNVANGNARVLLQSLGLDCEDLYGEIRSLDLRKACEAAAGMEDPGEPGFTDRTPGRATLVYCGRSAGRVHYYLESLMGLCDRAGDLGIISWG